MYAIKQIKICAEYQDMLSKQSVLYKENDTVYKA